MIWFDLVGEIGSALKPDVAWGLFHAQVTAGCVQHLKYNPEPNISLTVITGDVLLSYSHAKPNCVSNTEELKGCKEHYIR